MATDIFLWPFEEEGRSTDLNTMIGQLPLTALVAATPPYKEKSSTETSYPTTPDIVLLVSPCISQVLVIGLDIKVASGSATVNALVQVQRGALTDDVHEFSTGATTWQTKLQDIDMINLPNCGDCRAQEVTINIFLKTSNAASACMVRSLLAQGVQTFSHMFDL